MGERVATVQLEEIGLIRMVSERGVKYWSETDTICIQAKSSTRHGVLRAEGKGHILNSKDLESYASVLTQIG